MSYNAIKVCGQWDGESTRGYNSMVASHKFYVHEYSGIKCSCVCVCVHGMVLTWSSSSSSSQVSEWVKENKAIWREEEVREFDNKGNTFNSTYWLWLTSERVALLDERLHEYLLPSHSFFPHFISMKGRKCSLLSVRDIQSDIFKRREKEAI